MVRQDWEYARTRNGDKTIELCIEIDLINAYLKKRNLKQFPTNFFNSKSPAFCVAVYTPLIL